MNYRCASCLKVIPTKGNTKYCSKKCRSDSPPRVIDIQYLYGADITTVITDVLRRNSITHTAEILGIDRGTLYTYLRKYNITKNGRRWEGSGVTK
jgi:transcriptional regulator with PAS, ATPase and Fis domain